MTDYYIASCCIPDYRVEYNTNRITNPEVQGAWKQLPVTTVASTKPTPSSATVITAWRGSGRAT